jgi:UDP-glucose 4-epimerase
MGLKDSMVPRLMRAVLGATVVEVYGDGEQVRDFVHVDDVARAFLLALTEDWHGPTIIAAGRSHSVNELIEMTRTVTGGALPTRNVPAKAGEMPAVVVDPSRAHSQGWKAEISMVDGLASAWEWFQTAPAQTAR